MLRVIVFAGIVLAAIALGGVFFFGPKNLAVGPQTAGNVSTGTQQVVTSTPVSTSTSTPAVATSSETSTPAVIANATPTPLPVRPIPNVADVPPQQPLANPPAIVKGVYVTAWVAGSPSRMQQIIHLVTSTELNAVVIDLKDYSGYVTYAIDDSQIRATGAENQLRVLRPNALIKELHDQGIYVIGRITDFQDPVLARAHPEWALHNKSGGVWYDNNGLAWMDPAAQPVWSYLGAIAGDALNRGFDEIQFDYIRFASDGALGNISYPYWDMKTPRATVIEDYFKYLRAQFPDKKLSVDLFGLSTVNSDDLGIGQVIQDAYKYFDYVSPMVYPSHYATGFLGYANPGKYPYEVISYSLENAIGKLGRLQNSYSTAATASTSMNDASGTGTGGSLLGASVPPDVMTTKLRPWLQDFSIYGVLYTPQMIRLEKQAVYDTLATSTGSAHYAGWLMWSAGNVYTASALDPKPAQ